MGHFGAWAEKLIVLVFGAFFDEHLIDLLLDHHNIIIIILLVPIIMLLLFCVYYYYYSYSSSSFYYSSSPFYSVDLSSFASSSHRKSLADCAKRLDANNLVGNDNINHQNNNINGNRI